MAEPRRRTAFGPVLVVGLLAAALATVGAGSTWAEATTTVQGTRTVEASGTDVAPATLPLALVALACWGAVLVLRSRGRRVVSVLGLLASTGAAAAALTSRGDAAGVAYRLLGGASDITVSTSSWPWMAVGAALVAAAAFAVAFVQAPRWPEMSSRYDAPADRGPAEDTMSDADLWRALDQGHDPTT